jgi:hypothetical protein
MSIKCADNSLKYDEGSGRGTCYGSGYPDASGHGCGHGFGSGGYDTTGGRVGLIESRESSGRGALQGYGYGYGDGDGSGDGDIGGELFFNE